MPGSEEWSTISILMKRDETIQSHQKGVFFTYSCCQGIGNRIINVVDVGPHQNFRHGSQRYPNASKLTSVREREQPRVYPEGYKFCIARREGRNRRYTPDNSRCMEFAAGMSLESPCRIFFLWFYFPGKGVSLIYLSGI